MACISCRKPTRSRVIDARAPAEAEPDIIPQRDPDKLRRLFRSIWPGLGLRKKK